MSTALDTRTAARGSASRSRAPKQIKPGDPAIAARLLAIATSMVPTLRARAHEADSLCKVPPETIRELHEAGIFKMSVPVEYGGYALTPSQQHAIVSEIGRGCASTAWVVWVTGGGTQLMALYDRSFQDEAFKADWAGPLNSGVANGSGPGVARKVDGGYMLKGRWPFCSGCHYTAWHHLGALCRDGDKVESIIFMVAHDQIAILDDWKVMGLRGTGSNTVVIEHEIFIPDAQARQVPELVMMVHPQEPRDGLVFKFHLLVFAAITMSGAALGAARAAVELIKEKVRTRGITNSNYPKQDEAPITHIQLGELHCKLLTAELVAKNNLARAEEIVESGQPADELVLARAMLETAYVHKLCSEITELVLRASGASSIHENSPFQRLFRDSRVPTLHGQSTIETALEHYGRAIMGLPVSAALQRI